MKMTTILTASLAALAAMLTSVAGASETRPIQPKGDAPANPPLPPLELREAMAKRGPQLPIEERQGLVTMLADNFEGAFPGTTWTVYNAQGAADARWGKTGAFFVSPSSSVFCAGAGSQAVAPGQAPYPDNMSAWMGAGPFNFSDAIGGLLQFNVNVNSELNFDYFYVYLTIDPNFAAGTFDFDFGSGNTGGWQPASYDMGLFGQSLSNFLGQQNVYVFFGFESDPNTAFDGALIDDVVITKQTSGQTPSPTPPPTPTVSPTPSPIPTTATPTPTPTASTPTPTPTPTPTLEPGVVEKTFEIRNVGRGFLEVTGITKQNNRPWVTVIAPQFPIRLSSDQRATITVRVNKNGLSNGVHTERLLVASNDPDENPYPNGVHINVNIGGVSVQPIIDKLTGTGTGGTDANSDNIIDCADVRRLLQ